MLLNICGNVFDSNSIRNIAINNRQCFVDTDEDYHVFRINSPDDIVQAEAWIKFSTLNDTEVYKAYHIIKMVCSWHINRMEQCNTCPIHKHRGCIFPTPPINWR